MTMTPDPTAIAEGDDIGTRTWPSGLAAWNRYAAVNDEFYPVHMDHEAARQVGMPAAIGMGNLQVAYFHAFLGDWLGERGRVRALSMKFKSPSLEGTVTAGGSVSRVVSGDSAVEATLDVWTRDHDGRDLCVGTAVVELDAAHGPTS